MITLLFIVNCILQAIYALHLQEPCSCYMLGTQQNSEGVSICKNNTLECKCHPHVTGRDCDQCEYGFYNILSGSGCTECKCDPKGTVPYSSCDSNGICLCNDGYYGYRCENLIEGDCRCEEIVKEEFDKFRHKLSDIENILEEDADLDSFDPKIKNLSESIKILYQNVLKVNSVPIIKNDIPKLLQDIARIKYDFENLLSKLPKQTDISDLEENFKAIELSFIHIKELDLGNIDDILKKITDIADRLDKLVPLLDNITKTYNTAKTSVEHIERKTNTIKKNYLEKNKNFKLTLDKSKILSSGSRNAYRTALEHKKMAENITFPTHQPNKTECVIVPEFNDTYEENMAEQFKRTKDQQYSIDKAYKELENHKIKTEIMIEENVKDVQRLKTRLSEIDERVSHSISVIEELLKIQNLNDYNEEDLKILQNELQHLIDKLRVFTDQVRVLERFVKDNNEMIEKLNKKLQEFNNNIDITKEANAFLNALPSTQEELDEIEREINQAEKYFELIDKKAEIERELEGLKNIVKELEALPSRDVICPKNIKPEF